MVQETVLLCASMDHNDPISSVYQAVVLMLNQSSFIVLPCDGTIHKHATQLFFQSRPMLTEMNQLCLVTRESQPPVYTGIYKGADNNSYVLARLVFAAPQHQFELESCFTFTTLNISNLLSRFRIVFQMMPFHLGSCSDLIPSFLFDQNGMLASVSKTSDLCVLMYKLYAPLDPGILKFRKVMEFYKTFNNTPAKKTIFRVKRPCFEHTIEHFPAKVREVLTYLTPTSPSCKLAAVLFLHLLTAIDSSQKESKEETSSKTQVIASGIQPTMMEESCVAMFFGSIMNTMKKIEFQGEDIFNYFSRNTTCLRNVETLNHEDVILLSFIFVSFSPSKGSSVLFAPWRCVCCTCNSSNFLLFSLEQFALHFKKGSAEQYMWSHQDVWASVISLCHHFYQSSYTCCFVVATAIVNLFLKPTPVELSVDHQLQSDDEQLDDPFSVSYQDYDNQYYDNHSILHNLDDDLDVIFTSSDQM